MKLDEAIEIVSDFAHGGVTTFNQDYNDAQKLLIEAGKRILKYRQDPCHVANIPLKGETTDKTQN